MRGVLPDSRACRRLTGCAGRRGGVVCCADAAVVVGSVHSDVSVPQLYYSQRDVPDTYQRVTAAVEVAGVGSGMLSTQRFSCGEQAVSANVADDAVLVERKDR